MGRDRVLVKSVGQCTLLSEGEAVTSLEAKSGDVLVLKNALVLLVVDRPLRPRRTVGEETFPFGEADPDGLIGESIVLADLRERLQLAADSGHHVLISGPSGSGKELCARSIHRRSNRSSGPFVSRNAATIPEGLVDAELFGCAKGYPNAGSPERSGLIAEAHQGTLFLDEIGELPHGVQAHLLRVLDEGGEYQRLGETRPRTSSFRAVGATNRPITSLKHDLGARFTARIETPSLGQRREDIPLLMRGIFLRFSRESPGVMRRFEFTSAGETYFRTDPLLVSLLLRHHFETHLRELALVLWSAVESSQGDFIQSPARLAERILSSAKPEVTTTSAPPPIG